MNENIELYKHINKDCDMAIFTMEKLLKEIKEKDNKIKNLIEDILKEYKKFYEDSKKYLKKCKVCEEENSTSSKMGAGMGIKKEVQKDNSDAAIASMMIEGISMGTIEMEKKIINYKDIVSHKELNMAKEFLKFQERSISKLKEFF